MNAQALLLPLAAALGGILGGLVNAVLSDHGLKMWFFERPESGPAVFRLGFLENILVGFAGGMLNWGLTSAGIGNPSLGSFGRTFAAAGLIGVAGSSYFSLEGKRRLEEATSQNLADAGLAGNDRKQE